MARKTKRATAKKRSTKKSAKPKQLARPKRTPRQRTLRRDEFGIPLTSSGSRFVIRPSDYAPAFELPPNLPKKGTGRADPKMPTTTIPELRVIEFTEYAYHCVIAAIIAADKVQVES